MVWMMSLAWAGWDPAPAEAFMEWHCRPVEESRYEVRDPVVRLPPDVEARAVELSPADIEGIVTINREEHDLDLALFLDLRLQHANVLAVTADARTADVARAMRVMASSRKPDEVVYLAVVLESSRSGPSPPMLSLRQRRRDVEFERRVRVWFSNQNPQNARRAWESTLSERARCPEVIASLSAGASCEDVARALSRDLEDRRCRRRAVSNLGFFAATFGMGHYGRHLGFIPLKVRGDTALTAPTTQRTWAFDAVDFLRSPNPGLTARGVR